MVCVITLLSTCCCWTFHNSIAAVAPFTGLHRFPQGQGFKQWTSNNSKALMKVCPPYLYILFIFHHQIHKVYIAAIEDYVPNDIIRTFRAFIEFCYLIHRNVITDSALSSINDATQHFHHYWEVFKTTGVASTFSLPCQHSVKHYPELIQLFGTPNRLCSSITENKHITEVKKPYRQSNKYKALGQILVTNQRLDELSAAWTDFANRSMLNRTCLSSALKLIGMQSIKHHLKCIRIASSNQVQRQQRRDEPVRENTHLVLDTSCK